MPATVSCRPLVYGTKFARDVCIHSRLCITGITLRNSVAQFVDRMIRAGKLEARLFGEVEADTSATGQARGVVLLSSVAAGIGYVVQGGLAGLVIGTVVALFGWYVWVSIPYIVGAKLLPMPQTSTSHGALVRTLGFASAPGLLRVLGVVPGLTGIAFLVAAVWMLMATVVAAQQALDYTSTARAGGVCVVGWLVQVLIMLPLFILFGGD
jgi:hypothetical protein